MELYWPVAALPGSSWPRLQLYRVTLSVARARPGPMTYANQAALAADQDFTKRLQACLCVEAQAKVDDALATAVLRTPWTAAQDWFMPFISTAPGFGDAYGDSANQQAIDDGMILSAVQASWDAVAAVQAAPSE